MTAKIFYGVPFYTMDSDRSVKNAVVVDNGKINYVADNPNEAHNRYPDAELVELSEGCVLPGFIDAHIHLKEFSLLFKDLDLFFIEHRDEVLDSVKNALEKKKSGEWLVAGGLGKSLLQSLTKEHLDAISENNAVVLFTGDMRSVIGNSSALLAAKIDESRRDPLGGIIERDSKNQPNGILHDRAVEIIRKCIPEEKSRVVDAAIEKGIGKILSNGITTICDCSTRFGTVSIRYLMKLMRHDKLYARVVAMVGEKDAIRLGEIGLSSLFGNDYLRLGGFLVVIDGSLSSLTGYMSAPYKGSSNNGLLLMDEQELYEMLKNHFSLYFWAALQCVGDGANEIALRVLKRVDSERGIPQLLKRIDFAQALKDEDIKEFARGDIVAVIIPGQIPSDRENAMMYLGTEARLLFRTQSLLNAGVHLAFASNAPATPINPFYSLYCAVERKRFDDGPEMRFYPRERIALIDAVYAYTMGSARACGFEKEVGSIETQKFADLIHLSTDIFSNETDILRETVVQTVYVGGEKVYQRGETG